MDTGGLRSHRRTHEGDAGKRYRCDRCPYRTFFKQCLDVHYRIHLGEVLGTVDSGSCLSQGEGESTSAAGHRSCDVLIHCSVVLDQAPVVRLATGV